MDQEVLAREIADAVVRDTQFWIAGIGLLGAIIGAAITVLGSLLLYWFQSRKENNLDKDRAELLRQMLKNQTWRNLSTLGRVVGADADTTKRLLIHIKARGSENPREDGEEPWGLISKHPLEKIE